MAKFSPAKATAAAMKRQQRGERIDARFKWYGDRIAAGVKIVFAARLKIVGENLRDRMIAHISVPVGYEIGPRGGIRVTQRSLPGEHPRTQAALPDGGQLVRSMFYGFPQPLWLRVGTTLDYGLFLETGTSSMAARPYIVRTLMEQLPAIRRILGAPLTVVPFVPPIN